MHIIYKYYKYYVKTLFYSKKLEKSSTKQEDPSLDI